MQLRFITYNIQFGRGQDGAYDLDRIADALADADLACLQEVTTHWDECNGDHQPDVLSQKLNMFASYAPGFETGSSFKTGDGRVQNRRRGFGNVILSRWPIVYSRSHSLTRPPTDLPGDFPDPRLDLPRCLLEGVIDIPGSPLRVMSVHLSHLPGGQREQQVAALRGLLRSLPEEAPLWERSDPMIEPWTEKSDGPPVPRNTIVAGDFNLRPDDPEYRQMLEPAADQGLADGWLLANGNDRIHPPTCVEDDGSGTTLDYMFLTPGLAAAVVGATVRNEVTASDHFPVECRLDL